YADFMWVAADQLFNQIGKARHMFGGRDDVPLVLRTKVAMGTGYGSQHSMDPAGVFATAPGWRIVAPSTPFDYVGLMNTALRCKGGRKTGHVLIAEQGPPGTSYGGWLADEIQRRFFDWLDAPVERLTGSEASPSISKVLEHAAIAQTPEVVAKLIEIKER